MSSRSKAAQKHRVTDRRSALVRGQRGDSDDLHATALARKCCAKNSNITNDQRKRMCRRRPRSFVGAGEERLPGTPSKLTPWHRIEPFAQKRVSIRRTVSVK